MHYASISCCICSCLFQSSGIVTNFIQTITLGILDWFQQSNWPPKALKKTFQKVSKNVSKQSVFTELSADQSVITKLPDTKLPISRELLNIIICFNDHHEALFNVLLSAINRTTGNKIPWRYKVLNVYTWHWSLPIDYHLFLNRTKDCPKMVRLSLFQEQ